MDIIAPVPITADAQLISSSITETDKAAYAAGTTYAANAEVQVTADGVHKIYRSAVAGNVGHYPPDNIYDDTVDPATGYWIEVSSTNRWKMFDGKSRASSIAADQIIVEFAPGELFNSLALLNVEASSATVEVIDSIEGLVYFAGVDLVDYSGIIDFYEWFFYEPIRKNAIPLTDLPSFSGATIKVTLTAPGETVTVGEIVAGVLKYIGKLQYGYSVSIQDYSTKEKDEAGAAKVIEGVYSDTGSFKVVVDSIHVYDIKRTLGLYRATPLVWIGADWRQDSIIYGYYTDFDVSIETLSKSYCSIEVEELS